MSEMAKSRALNLSGQKMCYLVFKVGKFGVFVRVVEISIVNYKVKWRRIYPDVYIRVYHLSQFQLQPVSRRLLFCI